MPGRRLHPAAGVRLQKSVNLRRSAAFGHFPLEKYQMLKIALPFAALAAVLSLSACESPADKAAEQKADAIENQGEAQADALERQAAATSNEAAETALNNKADAVENAADARADAIEQAAGKKD
jgi:hypothetical protein